MTIKLDDLYAETTYRPRTDALVFDTGDSWENPKSLTLGYVYSYDRCEY